MKDIKARVLAVMNQKGGVGKTTTACNMSHALSRNGYRVLVIDMDPQAHLSASFGIHKKGGPGVHEVLTGKLDIQSVVHEVRKNLFLVSCGLALADLENERIATQQYVLRLRREIDDITNMFDFIVLDCPPASGKISMSALFNADEVIIPVTGDYLSLNGVAGFIKVMNRAIRIREKSINHWIVMTRFQSRRKLAIEVRNKMLEHFPGKVLATPVRENVALAECPGFGLSIFEYASSSQGAQDYTNLVDDYLTANSL